MNDDPRSIATLRDALGSEYDVKRQLGRGSTSTVYEAQEVSLGRSVAIKVLHPFLAEDATSLKRFEEEARAVAALSHPHVARAYRFGKLEDETPYLVMRLVKGRTMEDRLKAEGMLLPELAIPVLRNVASGLAAAHAIGVVHRDVRPANVLWDQENDVALLVDFGISALFTPAPPGMAVPPGAGPYTGDPGCMSPEQIRGDRVGVLADVYGLGVMGYELLTGEGPYGSLSGPELIEAHLHGEPKDLMELRADLEPNVANVLRRCLDKQPENRPPASDVVRALDGIWQLPPLGGTHAGIVMLTERKLGLRAVAAGFVVSGSLAGGVATLNEQYDFMPAWAFTESLATGVAIILASVVIGWFHGAEGRQRIPLAEYVVLSVIVAVWVAASVLIIGRPPTP